MSKIIESSQIPVDEKVYLKKDFLGWRVVEPILDENKNIIWANVFSKRGMMALFIILIVLGFGWLAFEEQIDNYNSVMKEPCKYCKDCMSYKVSDEFDFTNIELDLDG